MKSSMKSSAKPSMKSSAKLSMKSDAKLSTKPGTKSDTKPTLWERYFTKEIGIEFKACLYFFAILFYYCCYRLWIGLTVADILHMAEMILLTYIMGYVQLYLLWNFDEAEEIGGKEIFAALLCTAVYTILSWLGGWFDGRLWVILGFGAYVLFMYAVVVWIFKYRRMIDDKILNADLENFKKHKDGEE